MPWSRTIGSALIAVWLTPAAGVRAQTPQDPRGEMEDLAHALESAVRQVSRASAAQSLGLGDSSRAYALKGYGAFFVLAPRALPRLRGVELFVGPPGFEPNPAALDRAVRSVEEGLRRVRSPELRALMEQRLAALRSMQERVRSDAAPHPAPPRVAPVPRPEDQLRALEEQARAFEREADASREEAETALRRVANELEGLPPTPEAPRAPTTTLVPMPEPPAPPWRFWLESQDEPGRSAEAVLNDVRKALTGALEAHGPRLRTLSPEERIVVAVDFYPVAAFGLRDRPLRTLLVRVVKKDLLERAAGRIGPDELRRRIDYQEY